MYFVLKNPTYCVGKLTVSRNPLLFDFIMTSQNFPVSWRPSGSIEALKLRAVLLKRARNYFDSLNYTEVQTPVISRDTTIDRWLEPITIKTDVEISDARPASPVFLQTSPEFAMKRLLAAGMGSIYQICPAFRDGEYGQRHNPEFTIIEWYGVNDDFSAGMTVLEGLCQTLLKERLTVQAAERIPYRDAFLRYANLDPFAASMEQIRNYCQTENLGVPDGFDPDDRDSWLDVILSEKVQIKLGFNNDVPDQWRPTVLYHYPATQSALAKVVEAPYGAVAERFELFVGGVELANGYHELADADELARRHEFTNRQRVADGHAPLPPNSILLDALHAGFPPCAGCALGFDRAVMLAFGTSDLRDVLAFDWGRA